MHKTTDDQLNPAGHWAYTVRRVMVIQGWGPTWMVDTFKEINGTIRCIHVSKICTMIRLAVNEIRDALGFTLKDVGTHSNRLVTAMAMYLANVLVYTIMLAGRWSFNAFLLYTRKQVQEFTKGISDKMLIMEDCFIILDEAAGIKDTGGTA